MAGIFEGSFAASVRVDARDLAVMAGWMRDNQQKVTRSGIVGQALKVVARSVLEQEPERKVETLEQAYTKLDELGLAPQSTRGLLNMARALQTEHMAQSGNMESVIKHLRHVATGSGLAKQDMQMSVAQEVMDMSTTQRAPSMAQKLDIDDDDMEMLNEATSMMRRRGDSAEDIDIARDKLVGSYQQRNRQKERERVAAEKQAHEEQITKFKQQAAFKEPELTPEQRTANFEGSVIKELGDEWEGPIHKRVIENTRANYMKRTPDATDEEFDAWLANMVEAAKHAIESRAERNKEAYEVQERERALRKQAKEAVEA
jgi:hypothetical protein